MQANPYATSRLSTDDSQAPPLRPVIRYWLLSVLSMGIGSLFAIPAFILLTNGQIGIFDISVNGHPVTNKSAIAWSLGISIPLFVLWIGSAIIAMRNMRRNLFKT